MKTIYEYSSEMDRFMVQPGSIDEYLDFEAIFNSSNPVEIEIGTGKGRFLLAESAKRPETNFLGIERSLKWIRVALLRLYKQPRENCRLLCLNADFVVKLLIRPGTVQAHHVYFPDPWPKERHQKRRLFNSRFIEKLAETLVKDGHLFFKTDHASYFETANESILQSGCFEAVESETAQELLDRDSGLPDTATHYEIKFRKEARTIYYSKYRVLK